MSLIDILVRDTDCGGCPDKEFEIIKDMEEQRKQQALLRLGAAGKPDVMQDIERQIRQRFLEVGDGQAT